MRLGRCDRAPYRRREGEYEAHVRFDAKRMDGTLYVHEPASGPLENILQLPGLGALSAILSIAGPHQAELVDLELDRGELTAAGKGRIDLTHASMDLDYSLESPALSPRPDLKWQRLALNGKWHGALEDPTASGHLQADRLELPGGLAIAALRAEIASRRGTLSLDGAVAGLRIPGPQPGLFEKDPIKLLASMRMAEKGRPLTLEATHRLLSVKAHAVTTGEQRVSFDLRIPSLAPFAALAGEDVRGRCEPHGPFGCARIGSRRRAGGRRQSLGRRCPLAVLSR